MGQVIKWDDNKGGMMVNNDGDLCDVGVNVTDYKSFLYVSVFINGRMKLGYDIRDMGELSVSVRERVKEF